MAPRGWPSSRTEAGSIATIPRGYDTLREARVARSQRQEEPPLHGKASRGARPRRGASGRESRLDQRERERERRVSDADASYYGPATRTTTLNCAIPQRKHANYNPLSVATRFLSRNPHPKRLNPVTRTDPNESYVCPNPISDQDMKRLYTTTLFVSTTSGRILGNHARDGTRPRASHGRCRPARSR